MIFENGLGRALTQFGFEALLVFNQAVKVEGLLFRFFLVGHCHLAGHHFAELLREIVELATDRLFFLAAQALNAVLALGTFLLALRFRHDDVGRRHMHEHLARLGAIALVFVCVFLVLELSCGPRILGSRLRRLSEPVLREYLGVKVPPLLLDCADELLHDLLLVDLHMDDALGLLARQLVLLDLLKHVVDARRSFLLHVVDGLALADSVQAAHDRGLNEAYRSIHVVVLQLRNQHLVRLLD